MATIKIGNVTGAIYQTEQPIHLNPDGSGQATITYKCAEESQFAVIPAYLTSHPYLPELKAYESDLDHEPGGIIRITTIYKGVLADNPEELAQHDFSRTVSQEPIETHPLFALPRDNPPVTPKEINIIELALQNAADPVSPLGAKACLLYEKKRKGIDSYLRSGSVYRKSYVSADIPSAGDLEGVGKIKAPGTPAPEAPNDQEYLFVGLSWNKTAGVVTITEEYQLSGIGGWDPDLYS
tara:strand:- start:3461 stop:4174 length:714 start_codon:yes stop_codon:yes gene_type:complete